MEGGAINLFDSWSYGKGPFDTFFVGGDTVLPKCLALNLEKMANLYLCQQLTTIFMFWMLMEGKRSVASDLEFCRSVASDLATWCGATTYACCTAIWGCSAYIIDSAMQSSLAPFESKGRQRGESK